MVKTFLLQNKMLLLVIALVLWIVLASRPQTPEPPRFELFRGAENSPHVFLLDTRTGQVWSTFATPNQSAGKFNEITPDKNSRWLR